MYLNHIDVQRLFEGSEKKISGGEERENKNKQFTLKIPEKILFSIFLKESRQNIVSIRCKIQFPPKFMRINLASPKPILFLIFKQKLRQKYNFGWTGISATKQNVKY